MTQRNTVVPPRTAVVIGACMSGLATARFLEEVGVEEAPTDSPPPSPHRCPSRRPAAA